MYWVDSRVCVQFFFPFYRILSFYYIVWETGALKLSCALSIL